jgi:hypothetical protein
MAVPALSRRAFLGVSGGMVLAAAGGLSQISGASTPSRRASYGGLVLSTDVHASEAPQRFAFALAKGSRYASGPEIQIAYGPQTDKNKATLGTFQPSVLHKRGLPSGRGIYTTEIVVPTAGVYEGVLKVKGKQVPLAFQVNETSAVPAIGQAAPRAASPTVAAPLDVTPICTRHPRCPLHDRSLDTLIGAGRPVVLMFATPARCQSQYCGPVLDDLLSFKDRYADRVDFVHVEIYQNNRTSDTIPTVQAWGLPGEPWVFGVDGAGNVVATLDGAFGTDEQERLVQKLLGPA